jgi:hypothetical protein
MLGLGFQKAESALELSSNQRTTERRDRVNDPCRDAAASCALTIKGGLVVQENIGLGEILD